MELDSALQMSVKHMGPFMQILIPGWEILHFYQATRMLLLSLIQISANMGAGKHKPLMCWDLHLKSLQEGFLENHKSLGTQSPHTGPDRKLYVLHRRPSCSVRDRCRVAGKRAWIDYICSDGLHACLPIYWDPSWGEHNCNTHTPALNSHMF